MHPFQQEISTRLAALRPVNIDTRRKELSDLYFYVLPYEYQQEGLPLSDHDVAFLDLYHERSHDLKARYMPALLDVAAQVCPDAEREHGAPPEDLLELNCILLPPTDSDTHWELDLSFPFHETIFHVRFDGWAFTGIGQTD